MPNNKFQLFLYSILAGVLLGACGSTNNIVHTIEDDVYFSKKAANDKAPVYVPEVDVKEIIKANPTQYGNEEEQTPTSTNFNSDNSNVNPNAAAAYPSYRAALDARNNEETETQNQFLNTIPYEEDGAADAQRLRMQYAGSFGNYFGNGFGMGFGDPFWGGNAWNSGFNLGWNNQFGWGMGFNSGWGNPYWGWNNPWGWNRWNRFGFYDPWCAWGGNGFFYDPWYQPWGMNGWYDPWGWNRWGWRGGSRWWGHNRFDDDIAQQPARPQRPRGQSGTTMPRPAELQAQTPNGTGTATPQAGERIQMPRPGAQLVNRDGQVIYVPPQEYRSNVPRGYDTYPRSINRSEAQRAVTPRSNEVSPQVRPNNTTINRSEPARNNYQPSNNEIRRTPAPAPQPRNDRFQPAPQAPRSQPRFEPTPRSAPSGGGGGGGGRGGSGGGGGGGSAPRPRSR